MTKIFQLKNISERAGNYVAGFVDGEGSFYLSVRKHNKLKDGVVIYDRPTGWRFSISFNIANNDRKVLEFCRAQLCCGDVRESSPGKFVLEVQDQKILKNQIVPFFQKFQFVSIKKRHEFRVFQILLKFFDEGQITTTSRMLSFLKLRKLLSRYRDPKHTHSDEFIQETFKHQSLF